MIKLTTIRDDNYAALKELGDSLGIFVPRTLSPLDEYTIGAQGLKGSALLRTIRTASVLACCPSSVYNDNLKWLCDPSQ